MAGGGGHTLHLPFLSVPVARPMRPRCLRLKADFRNAEHLGSLRSGEVRRLCKQCGVERLDILGSAATGEGLEPAGSDLGFLVEPVPLEPDLLDAVNSNGSAGASPSLDPLMMSF